MVPARPFFIGSDGWVRSRAWIWLFSSTHSTTALSGGFRYSPTTSVSFSRNRLSLETLKVRTRWGWSPAASQIRPTVAGLTPATFARSEEHTSELQSRPHLVCRLLLEKKKQQT